MKRPTSPPRGTQDILPATSGVYHKVRDLAYTTLSRAGFQEIQTPIFESTEIFARAAGESSDIVNKEMYTFEDRSKRSITLRPEGTAGVVRAYLSNGLDRQVKPVKLWYWGPMFRYERSQVGRYRQFHQLGLEVFGSGGAYIELEGIKLAWDFVLSLGISEDRLSLEINNVGDMGSRSRYQDIMRQFLVEHRDQICPDCQRRIDTNPLRALDCKVESDQSLYQAHAPQIGDYLTSDCIEHRDTLFELLDRQGISYTYNQSLVRGLDYYTGTVFELKVLGSDLAQQNTICAGGRYDTLVEQFGGPSTKAFGWAFGIERLTSLIEGASSESEKKYFIVNEGQGFTDVYNLTQYIRDMGCIVLLDYDQKPFNKQFDLAQKYKCTDIIYYQKDQLVLRSLQDDSRMTFKQSADLVEYVAREMSHI